MPKLIKIVVDENTEWIYNSTGTAQEDRFFYTLVYWHLKRLGHDMRFQTPPPPIRAADQLIIDAIPTHAKIDFIFEPCKSHKKLAPLWDSILQAILDRIPSTHHTATEPFGSLKHHL